VARVGFDVDTRQLVAFGNALKVEYKKALLSPAPCADVAERGAELLGDMLKRRAGGGATYTHPWRMVKRRGSQPYAVELRNKPLSEDGRVAKGRHKASAPGEPPVRFSNTLYNSITYSVKRRRNGSEARVWVDDNIKKIRALEYGTVIGHVIEARPFLRPAFQKLRVEFGRLTVKGYNREMKKAISKIRAKSKTGGTYMTKTLR